MTNIIYNFKRVFQENIIKIAKHKVGFTFVFINSKITGIMKMHTFVIIHPFKSKVSGYPIINQGIHLVDVCLNVDESFYEFIHQNMLIYKKYLICEINEDAISWHLSTGMPLINILIKTHLTSQNKMPPSVPMQIQAAELPSSHCSYPFLMEVNFNDWYENANLPVFDFIVEIINPDTYCVPFPLKPIYFSINLTNDDNNYLKKESFINRNDF
jgi:hypothetical protein